jgi:TonB family protein
MMSLFNLLPESAASAILLFDSAVRATVILGVALGVTFLLRRRSAALRHLVLSLAVIGSLLTPLMTLVAPAWRPDVVDRVIRSVQVASGSALNASGANDVMTTESLRIPSLGDMRPSAANSGDGDGDGDGAAAAAGSRSAEQTALTKFLTSASRVLIPTWIAGVIIFAGVLLIGLARLRWLASQSDVDVAGDDALIALVNEIARARGVRRPIALLKNDRTRLLVTWGIRRPRVMLPAAAADWPEERLRVVISHELAHVRRGDWGTQLAAESLRALFWFNPLVWIACRRLRAESELACDDEVLNDGIEGADYAGHLLDLARVLNSPRHTYLSAPAMARPSSLEGRISAMLDRHLNRHPVTRAARAVTCALVLGLTLAVAGFAQSSYYTFSGTVVDSMDRNVPGVSLTLTNPSRGARYEIKTDASGRFEFVGLPSGDYGLEATREGFKAVKESIAIASGNVVNRRITLPLGEVHETILIVGGPSTASGQAQAQADRRRGHVAAGVVAERQRVVTSCKAETAGGDITPPMKLVDVRPIYSHDLSTANIGGPVTLDALINTEGDVQDLTVVTSPDPALATAAIEAVKQWQYTPTLLNCVPVDVRVGVSVTFTPKQ